MSTSLKKPETTAPKRTRTEWDAFITETLQLDERRKALAREVDDLEKSVKARKGEISSLVDDEAQGGPRTITLKNFRLSIVQVKKQVSWVTEFTTRLGAEMAKLVRDNVGTKDSLEIQSLKPPTTSAAA